MANPFRAWLTQPLPYFLALGTLIFVLDSWLSPADNEIFVPSSVRSEVALRLQTERGRAPSPDEVENELEKWRENEALYREGLRMGLLENDEVVRTHVANKLRYIASERAIIEEPTEAALRAYLQSHVERFREPTTFDIEHVFVSYNAATPQANTELVAPARARALQVLEKLRYGDSYQTAGDHFPRGPRFTGRSRQELERTLQLELGSVLDPPQIGVWGMVEGERGFHMIRVTRVAGGVPSFERLKQTLRLALLADEKERSAQRFVDDVQSRYSFEVER